jgi:hypothetical protein
MIPQAMRMSIRQWLREAVEADARLGKALLIIGLTARCLQRCGLLREARSGS